ncbi:OprO/OprP family phosphate-selective porin [Hyphomonas sp.]|uniref:OprO/OprP family phosphate-selective porin n=1 Tax=Hyphomonas sp. TaxID=87 RepID=UPI003528A1BD
MRTCCKFLAGSCLAIFSCFAPSAAAEEGWEIKPSFRGQVDYTWADASRSDFTVDSAELRQFRAGITAKKSGAEWKAELVTDDDGNVAVTDVYFKKALAAPGWSVRLGHFKTANSLDEQTSEWVSGDFERAAFTDAFEFERRLGVQLERIGDVHSFYAGVFASNVNDEAFSEGHAIAGRYVFTPKRPEGEVLHIGLSARWREAGGSLPDFRYRQRPFTHNAGRVVATPRLGGKDLFAGAEFAWLKGPAWIAAEAAILSDDMTGGGNATFTGGYLEAGYMLGGRRTYKGHKFDRPKIDRPVTEGGPGALLTAVRYDTLDLEDGDVNGGKLDTLILALDWYLTSRIHAGINFFRSEPEFGSVDGGIDPAFAAAWLAGETGDTITGATFRIQFEY